MLDTKIGEQYEDLICKECKETIKRKMSKLNKFALLRPQKTALMFQKAICSKCRRKIKKRMQKK